MPIANHAWIEVTPSDFKWESDALASIQNQLDENRGFRAYSNFIFSTSKSDYEVDLLVLSPQGVMHVELKHWSGEIELDDNRYHRTKRHGQRESGRNPRNLADQKSKALKSSIQKEANAHFNVPFINTVVFWTHPKVRITATREEALRGHCTLSRDQGAAPFVETLSEPSLAGIRGPANPLDGGDIQTIVRTLEKMGLKRQPKVPPKIGDWTLGDDIEARHLCTDRLLAHPETDEKRVARIYDRENEKSKRIAEREYTSLEKLVHRGIEKSFEHRPDFDMGPTVIVKHYEASRPLDDLVEDQSNLLTTAERLQIIESIAVALSYAHQSKITHRALSPSAIQVEESGQEKRAVLGRWHLGPTAIGGTLGIFQTSPEVDHGFLAPEVRDGSNRGGEAQDVYSLGALLLYIFGGRGPDREGDFVLDGNGLRPTPGSPEISESILDLVKRATFPSLDRRQRTVDEFLECLRNIGNNTTESDSSLLNTVAGDGFEVSGRIGEGSIGVAFQASYDGRACVLKQASSVASNPIIEEEAAILEGLRHRSVVKFLRNVDFQGRQSFLMENAGDQTLGELIRRTSGRLSDDDKHSILLQIFDALEYLESTGYSHGDLKPDHIGISGPAGNRQIKIFDFSAATGTENHGGSHGYADPFSDDLNAGFDRYAAAVITHELLTNDLPIWGDGETSPRYLDLEQPTLSSKLTSEQRLVLSKALTRKQDSRFSSAAELSRSILKTIQPQRPAAIIDRPAPEPVLASKSASSAKSAESAETRAVEAERTAVSTPAKNMEIDPLTKVQDRPTPVAARRSDRLSDAPEASPRSNTAHRSSTPDRPRPQAPRASATRNTPTQGAVVTRQHTVRGVLREHLKQADFGNDGFGSFFMVSAPGLPPIRDSRLRTTYAVAEKILKRGSALPVPTSIKATLPAAEIEEDSLSAPSFGGIDWIGSPKTAEATNLAAILKGPLHDHGIQQVIWDPPNSWVNPALSTGVSDYDLAIVSPDHPRLLLRIVDQPDNAGLDGRLLENGWKIAEIPRSEITAGTGPRIQRIISLLSESAPRLVTPHTRQGTAALQWQMTVFHAILFEEHVESVKVFTETPTNLLSEATLAASCEDLETLLRHLAHLYGVGDKVPALVTTQNPADADITVSFSRKDTGPLEPGEWLIIPTAFSFDSNPNFYAAGDDQPVNIDRACAKFVLERIWGYPGFREGQFEAIDRGLQGLDTVILLPTGAGKSIVFQLASFLRPGTGVVVSPLTALMEDQVENLRRCGVSTAGLVTGSDSRSDRERFRDQLAAGAYAFIYISPERLQIDKFRRELRAAVVSRPVSVISIDEAHCVSEWGHDFRPAYLNIARNARELTTRRGHRPPLLALTGTASQTVLRDIQRELDIEDAEALITPKSFDRKELNFSIYKCRSDEKPHYLAHAMRDIAQRYGRDVTDLFSSGHAGLIFCPHTRGAHGVDDASRQGVRTMTESITGGAVFGFHSKSSRNPAELKALRRDALTGLRNGRIDTLVCTKGFGTGIDIDHLRYTVHYNLPSSIESFYQEAGRAGRDGHAADSVVLLSSETFDKNPDILEGGVDLEKIREWQSQQNTSWNDDDITRSLYFHNSSWSGEQKELEGLDQLLNAIAPLEHPGQVDVPDNLLSGGSESRLTERAIHRLLTVGVISDYTVDYAGGVSTYTVFKSGANHARIRSSLYDYTCRFSHRDAKRSLAVLPDDYETISLHDFAALAGKTLTEFIYRNVERSSRSSLREMYLLADAGSRDPEEARRRILEYLEASPQSPRIQAIIDASNDADPDISGLQGVDIAIEIAEELDADAARKVRGQSARMRTDTDVAGLTLLRSLSEALTDTPDPDVVAQTSREAFEELARASEEESVADETFLNLLVRTWELIAQRQPTLLSAVVEETKSSLPKSSRAQLGNRLRNASQKPLRLLGLKLTLTPITTTLADLNLDPIS